MHSNTSTMEAADLIQVLCKQHRVIERVLALVERPHLTPDLARSITKQLRETFILHAQAEERVVYPRFARIRALAPWIHAARDEHETVANLIDDLPDPARLHDWYVAIAALRASIRRHFVEEEQMLLPHLLPQLDVHEARSMSTTLKRVLAPMH